MKRKLIFGFLGASILMGSQFTTANVFANENVAVVAEESIGLENNVIKMRGKDLQAHAYKGFDIMFNTKEQKIEITNMLGNSYQIHNHFNEKYMGIKLIGQDGTEKASVELQGTDKTRKAAESEINGAKFEYGDILEVYHREAHKSDNTKAPFIVEGNVEGQQNNLNTHKYKLTENGLREIFDYKNVIQMRGLGAQGHPYKGFDIMFNTEEGIIELGNVYGAVWPIHPYFNDSLYMKIELVGQDDQVKGMFQLKGSDLLSNINLDTNTLDGAEFEYGDTLKIYHAEGTSSRYKVTGDVKGDVQTSKEHTYKITNTGLEEIR